MAIYNRQMFVNAPEKMKLNSRGTGITSGLVPVMKANKGLYADSEEYQKLYDLAQGIVPKQRGFFSQNAPALFDFFSRLGASAAGGQPAVDGADQSIGLRTLTDISAAAPALANIRPYEDQAATLAASKLFEIEANKMATTSKGFEIKDIIQKENDDGTGMINIAVGTKNGAFHQEDIGDAFIEPNLVDVNGVLYLYNQFAEEGQEKLTELANTNKDEGFNINKIIAVENADGVKKFQAVGVENGVFKQVEIAGAVPDENEQITINGQVFKLNKETNEYEQILDARDEVQGEFIGLQEAVVDGKSVYVGLTMKDGNITPQVLEGITPNSKGQITVGNTVYEKNTDNQKWEKVIDESKPSIKQIVQGVGENNEPIYTAIVEDSSVEGGIREEILDVKPNDKNQLVVGDTVYEQDDVGEWKKIIDESKPQTYQIGNVIVERSDKGAYDIVFTGEKEPTAFSEKMEFLKTNLTGQTNPETKAPYTNDEITNLQVSYILNARKTGLSKEDELELLQNTEDEKLLAKIAESTIESIQKNTKLSAQNNKKITAALNLIDDSITNRTFYNSRNIVASFKNDFPNVFAALPSGVREAFDLFADGTAPSSDALIALHNQFTLDTASGGAIPGNFNQAEFASVRESNTLPFFSAESQRFILTLNKVDNEIQAESGDMLNTFLQTGKIDGKEMRPAEAAAYILEKEADAYRQYESSEEFTNGISQLNNQGAVLTDQQFSDIDSITINNDTYQVADLYEKGTLFFVTYSDSDGVYKSLKGQDVPGAEPNQPMYAIDMDPPNGRLRYFTGKQLSAGN
jgi:hypothetical protein|tara:strand:+ start:822 stop:3233 length:2412 start_codon:yes stop_codon:yes gene_type:complete